LPPVIESNTVVCGPRAGKLGELIGALGDSLRAPVPLAVVSPNAFELVGVAAWFASAEADGLILPAERLTKEILPVLSRAGYRILELDSGRVHPAADRPVTRDRIGLLTSGTTGVPKLIEHSWQSLFTMSKVREMPSHRWLVTYVPGTYAWYQIVTLALFVPGQSLIVPRGRTPAELIDAALQHSATAISATPTFWRMAFLQFPETTLRRLALKQVTLGGERVDQALLDRLKAIFPEATIVHIYASTEAGACIIVRDGREGFPVSWLAGDTDRQLQVRDGILWLHSPHATPTQPDWINTGDAVEMKDDRVVIIGRAGSAIINVGGLKVSTSALEQRILEHPGVLWCRVSGRKAPLVGELVACDLVFRPGASVAEAELVKFCAQHFPEYMVPRIWNVRDTIPSTDNLKAALC
jgi:acyl-CoA synthetase (AMP-forming)/AMP-acid ligase II